MRSAFRERLCPGRDEHELLEVEVVLGVRAAVDDVHHRHRQDVGVRAAEPAIQRLAGVLGSGLGRGQRAAEDGVRSEPALRRRPVELDHRRVQLPLILGEKPVSSRASSPFTCSTARETPFRARRSPPSRSSTASCSPVEAPDGTAARPSAPDRARSRPRPSGCPGSRGSGARGRERSRWSQAAHCRRVARLALRDAELRLGSLVVGVLRVELELGPRLSFVCRELLRALDPLDEPCPLLREGRARGRR